MGKCIKSYDFFLWIKIVFAIAFVWKCYLYCIVLGSFAVILHNLSVMLY